VSLQILHDLSDLLASAFGDGWLLAFVVLLLSLAKKARRLSLRPRRRQGRSKKMPISPLIENIGTAHERVRTASFKKPE
jgi:hypothetical protein